LKPAWANSSQNSILKLPNTKNGGSSSNSSMPNSKHETLSSNSSITKKKIQYECILLFSLFKNIWLHKALMITLNWGLSYTQICDINNRTKGGDWSCMGV
jgi:hypothetical protein